MKVVSYESVEKNKVQMEGAEGCSMRQLITDADGAPNFAMRQFEVEPGGKTPLHSHPYEHEVFVLEGDGVVMEGQTERPISKGDVIYVAPNDVHQFRNAGSAPLKFLCLVPNDFANQPIHCASDSVSADGGK
ncbi:MAG: cupin domain-containing protein [Planctomycetota bacterium]|nr:cupin domain-containing protein [Planctomycetota bacterium]